MTRCLLFLCLFCGVSPLLSQTKGYLGQFATVSLSAGVAPYTNDYDKAGDDSAYKWGSIFNLSSSLNITKRTAFRLELTKHSNVVQEIKDVRGIVNPSQWTEYEFSDVLMDMNLSSMKVGIQVFSKKRGAISPMGVYHYFFLSGYRFSGTPIGVKGLPEFNEANLTQNILPGDFKGLTLFAGYEYGRNLFLTDHIFLNYAVSIQLGSLERLWSDSYSSVIKEENEASFKYRSKLFIVGYNWFGLRLGVGYAF